MSEALEFAAEVESAIGRGMWIPADGVARRGEADALTSLRVFAEPDGDLWVVISGPDANGNIETWNERKIEFCTRAGGGRAKRTREALIYLAIAMQLDNAETPHKNPDHEENPE